ncbi:MAG: alpha/beta hydrolase [Deltaproteobacteria bacterium]|nr:alpha/beta hydrolase [Deltaproteobacteria bacterium]MBP7286153.1 alpha/beta hydrolase [Nannocystaceae bacterium]
MTDPQWPAPLRPACGPAVPSATTPLVLPAATEHWVLPELHAAAAGQGPIVLAIPGLGCGPRSLAPVVTALAREARVVVVTLAGFGGLAPIEGPLLPRFCAGLRSLVEQHLRGPVTVLGHSLGGWLALALATQRLPALRAAIVLDALPAVAALLGDAAVPDAASAAADLQRIAARQRAEHRGLDGAGHRRACRSRLGAGISSLALVDALLDEASASDPDAVADAMAEILLADLRPACRAITAPVSCLAAAQSWRDPAARARARAHYVAQYAAIPGATLEWLEHARHFVALDDPARVVAHVRAVLRAVER